MRGLWGLALSFGPSPVGEAIQAAQALLDGATSILDRAEAQRLVGKLLAMRGEIEEAREHVRAGIEGTREAGQFVEAAGYCNDHRVRRGARWCAQRRRGRCSDAASPSSTVLATAATAER